MNKWRLLYLPCLSLLVALTIDLLRYGYHGGVGVDHEINNFVYIVIGLTSLALGIGNTLLQTNILVLSISAAIFGYIFEPVAIIAGALSGHWRSIDDPALYPLTNTEWQGILLLGGLMAIIPCLIPAIVLRLIKYFTQSKATPV